MLLASHRSCVSTYTTVSHIVSYLKQKLKIEEQKYKRLPCLVGKLPVQLLKK